MPEKYSWDGQAAKGIKDQKLDEHFLTKLDDYLEIARPVWTILQNKNKYPFNLKHADLYAPLAPIFEKTSMLQDAFNSRGLPQTGERGNAKWLCWFTNYVVEKCLEASKVGKGKALAKWRFKKKDKIRADVEAEIKAKK
jgi:hypothetical protein